MLRFHITNLIFRVSRALSTIWQDEDFWSDLGISALLFLITFLCALRFLAA